MISRPSFITHSSTCPVLTTWLDLKTTRYPWMWRASKRNMKLTTSMTQCYRNLDLATVLRLERKSIKNWTNGVCGTMSWTQNLRLPKSRTFPQILTQWCNLCLRFKVNENEWKDTRTFALLYLTLWNTGLSMSSTYLSWRFLRRDMCLGSQRRI